MNPIEELKILAAQMQAIAHYENSNAHLRDIFYRSSSWLERASRKVCIQGYFCNGGEKCRIDHK